MSRDPLLLLEDIQGGCEKIIRYAFEFARSQGRKKITCFTKDNIMKLSDGLFHKVFDEIATEYSDIENEHWIIDIGAAKLADTPEMFDVIVMPNLYGDILSDAAAGLIGGLGLAPSGCFGENYAYFESAHGSAPDIAGRNIINPTATLLSAALMLEYLGFEETARRLERAIERLYAEGRVLTPDQKGSASTTEFCEAVAQDPASGG